jgi:hypothetical protein
MVKFKHHSTNITQLTYLILSHILTIFSHFISQVATLKHGKFTPDEDIVIRRGVAEWGDKGRGEESG